MNLPLNYIIDCFFKYAGFPKYKHHTNIYEGCCPICREGKSWGKKKRLYFLPEQSFLCCKNCNKSWSPMNWIKDVSGLSYKEILKESDNYEISESDIERYKNRALETEIEFNYGDHTLPKDCINLTDPIQLSYYKDNQTVQDCLKYINQRRLFVAINKPKTYYISLTDMIHKNRLVIPFFDVNGQILFYQSRAIYKKDEEPAKYLSKSNSTFSIFGIDRITNDSNHIFIFEGPIDSTFVKNGIAVGGLSLKDFQKKQLETFRLYEKIWILDNQFDNINVYKKYTELIEKGEKVFIWPKELEKFKDMNEICVAFKLNKISPKYIIQNIFNGMKALLLVNQLSK